MLQKRLLSSVSTTCVTTGLFVCLIMGLAGCGGGGGGGSAGSGTGSSVQPLGYTLTGKVVMPDGSSGPNILVMASQVNKGGISRKQARVLAAGPDDRRDFLNTLQTIKSEDSDTYATVTDAEGVYILNGLEEGTYFIEASRAGMKATSQATVSPTEAAVVDMTLTPTGGITGHCLLHGAASDGHAGTFVVIKGTDYIGFTDDDGSFIMDQVPVDSYQVSFVHPGYESSDYSSSVQVPAAEVVVLDTAYLTPITGGTITGTVAAQDQQPLEKVMIRAEDGNGAEYFAVTDDLGQYRIDGVSPGVYSVEFEHDLVKEGSRTENVTVEEGATVTVNGSLTDGKAPVWESAPGVVYVTEIDPAAYGQTTPAATMTVAVEFGLALDASIPLTFTVYHNTVESWDAATWENNITAEYLEADLYEGIRGEQGVVLEGLPSTGRYVFGVRVEDRHGNLEYNTSEYLFVAGDDGPTTEERDNLLTAVGNIGIGTKDPQGLLHVEAESGAAFVVDGVTGNVGIGTTDPQAALTVGSTDGQQAVTSSTTGTFSVDSNGNVIAGAWQGDAIADDYIESVSGSKITGDIAASQIVGDIPSSQVIGVIPSSQIVGDIPSSQVVGDISSTQIVGDIPSSQIVGDIPSSQIAGTIPSSQISGDIPGAQITGNIAGNAANVTGTVAVANGGTGAVTAAAARSNLELGSLSVLDSVSGGTAGTIDDGTVTNDDVHVSAAIDFSKLNISKTDIINLGIPGEDTDTTYSAGLGITLENSMFSLDPQDAASGQVLKWDGAAWTPAADTDTDTKLTDSEIGDLGYIKTWMETDPTVDLAKLQALVQNDFHALGGTDADTQLSDSEIGGMGYIKTWTETDPTVDLAKLQALVQNDFHALGGTDADTQLSDSDIGNFGYIKTTGETDPTVDLAKLQALVQNDFHALGGTDADTQLTDTDITTMGYIKSWTEIDPTVDLTKLQALVQNDFHALGGTDADTQLSDSDITTMGYIKSWTETDPTVDLAKLQALVQNDFHNLGGTDADTTYSAGDNISFNGTVISTAADGHSLDAADSGPADVVFVDADGNVGIGVQSIGASLEVAGPVLIMVDGATFEINESVKVEAAGSTVTNAIMAAGTGSGTAGSSTQGVFGKAYYNGASTTTDFTLMPLASGLFGRAATGTYEGANSSIAANAVGVSGSATAAQLGSNTGVIGTARDGVHRNIGLLSLTNLSDLEIIGAYTALPAGFTAGLYSDNKFEGTNDYVIFAAGGADGSGGKSYFAGDVGIGTVAPADKLHVNGGVVVGTTTGTTAGTIRFTAGAFQGYTGSVWKSLDVEPTASAGGWTDGTNIVTLTTSGDNVGIGTADPGSYKLNVAGSTFFGGTVEIASRMTIDGREVSEDGAKLDTIEVNADVTDAINVAAAGAVMTGNIGTSVQAYHASLQSISGLTTAADKMLYTSAADTYAVAPLTGAGRALLDDADAAAQRVTLELGSAATAEASEFVKIAGDTMTGALALPASGLTVGSSQLVVAGGKVGIGTTAPATNLEIKGSAYPAVRVTSTNFEGGGVELWSSGGYYHVYVENDDLGFWNGDDWNKMTLTGEGNLVVGTTLPNEKLTVEGPVSLMGITTEPTATTDYGKLYVSNSDDKLYFVDDAGTSHSLLDVVKIGAGDSGTEVTDTGSNGYISFTTDNTEKARITSGGNVGIGTTVPESMLHVSGGKIYSEYNNGQLTATQIDDVSSDFGARGIAENYAGDLYMRSFWGVNIDRRGGNSDHSNYTNGPNSDGGSFAVRYRTDATTFRTDLLIDKDGNVGIGTTDPGSLLHVNSDSGNAYARVDSAANVEAGIQLHENGTMKWQLQNAGNDGDKFYICADGGNSNRYLTIQQDGKVGVGTTIPNNSLDVQGGAQFGSGNVDLVDATGKIPAISSTYFASLSGAELTGLNASNIGSGNLGVSSMPTGGTWNLTSDLNIDSVMYVDQANGRIGIGTTGPTSPLDVYDGWIQSRDATAIVSIRGKQTGTMYGFTDFSAIVAHGDVQPLVIGTHSSSDVALMTNGTQRLRITNTGNVGIGTDSPTEKLHVGGGDIRLDADQQLDFGDNYRTLSYLTATGHMSLQSPGPVSMIIDNNNNATTDYFAVMKDSNDPAAATELFRVQDNGNVGIGTDNPAHKLHVYNDGVGYLVVEASGANQANIFTKSATGDSNLFFQTNGGNKGMIGVKGADNKLFLTTGATFASTNGLVIDTSGNIGMGTTAPAGRLHVQKDSTSFAPALYLENDGGGNSGRGTGLLFSARDNGGFKAGIAFHDTEIYGKGTLMFLNRNSNDAVNADKNDTRMAITYDGNVGIGTTAPAAKLSVSELVQIQGDTSPQWATSGAGVEIGYDSDDSGGEVTGRGVVASIDRDTGTYKSLRILANDIDFLTGTTGIGTEKMRITNAGNVGIGTTTPDYLLHVANSSGSAYLNVEGGTDSQAFVVVNNDAKKYSFGVNSDDTFTIYDDTSAAHCLVINSGDIGVGTTTPGAKFDVNGAIKGTTVNTGQGDYELYAMNQNVRTTDSVTFAGVTASAVNTGVGDNELYAMNQNVRSTDSVTFAGVSTGGTVTTANVTASGTVTHGDWIIKTARGGLQNAQTYDVNLFSLSNDYHHGFVEATVVFHSYIGNEYHHGSFSYYVHKQTGAPAIVTLATHYDVDGPGSLVIDGLYISGNDVHFKITNNDASATYYTVMFKYMVNDP